ncbi:AMP-binding protein [Nocardia wallacei]|uniref:AMP-binding protein n=1 Tax=Nocardia wallacei TaxID=480035 RepID=UPI0024553112|nr:AMP-binding protein [Nocardia wallacei]
MDYWSAEVPSAEECVLGPLLRRQAEHRPDEVYAAFSDGTVWTFRDVLAVANEMAHRLVALNVRRGDRVLSWLQNGPDALRVWFGANLLGAVYVPLNPAYRGGLLEHAVRLSGARVMFTSPALSERTREVDIPESLRVQTLEWDGIVDHGATTAARPEQPVQPWDPYAIILTSGTTGPSKGVTCSYLHLASSSLAAFSECFGPGDRYMINLPLFHAGGTIGCYAALLLGGSVAIVDRFDTTTFWDTVRERGITHVTLLGVMATFLVKQPITERDRDHPLRHVFMVPLIEDVAGFGDRFGVSVQAMYNMTETSIPLISTVNPTTSGTCGHLRAGVQGRLVDEHDREVAVGEIGELIVRTDRPWAMNSGYWEMPEATASAWRNGWFHTGDAFRRDANGEFFFVDRVKDAIRRRGENISTFEVETELVAHPAVREAAVVGVPSPHGEDDVLAVVAPIAGGVIDPAELIEFARERMAHFMIPRYIRVVQELPKTPTAKIEKHRLRSDGITPDTWDREQAGIRVKQDKLPAQ